MKEEQKNNEKKVNEQEKKKEHIMKPLGGDVAIKKMKWRLKWQKYYSFAKDK